MRYQRGFTLIELLLYISLVSLLLGGLMAFFVMATSVRVKNQSIIEVDQQAQVMIDSLTQAIRNADTITAPVAAASGNSITLTSTTTALNPTVFTLSGTALQVKEGSAANVLLTSPRVQVTSFAVKNLSRASTFGTLQITFTLSTVNTTGRSEYDYQKTFTTSASLR